MHNEASEHAVRWAYGSVPYWLPSMYHTYTLSSGTVELECDGPMVKKITPGFGKCCAWWFMPLGGKGRPLKTRELYHYKTNHYGRGSENLGCNSSTYRTAYNYGNPRSGVNMVKIETCKGAGLN